jgi:hypothetical protein
MVSASSFQELPAVVANSGLTKFELELKLSIIGAVDEQSGAIVISLSLNRVLLLQK